MRRSRCKKIGKLRPYHQWRKIEMAWHRFMHGR